MAPTVSIRVARQLFNQNKPFVVRLENTTSRNAFWLIRFDPKRAGSHVDIHYGRIGSKGTRMSKPWSYAYDKANDKLSKDYRYAGNTQHKFPGPTHPTPKPKPTPKPITLVGPFALIRHLTQIAADQFKAFDDSGGYLFDLDSEGAEAVLHTDQFRITVKRLAA